jgi:hypothetical protein
VRTGGQCVAEGLSSSQLPVVARLAKLPDKLQDLTLPCTGFEYHIEELFNPVPAPNKLAFDGIVSLTLIHWF